MAQAQWELTIGGENTFTLLPEAERVRVRFEDIEPNQFNPNGLRWVFTIIDTEYEGDDPDVEDAIRNAADDGYKHYESINIPQGAIGKRSKLYKYLKGMSGGEYDEGDRVILDEFVKQEYLADFEHVDKQRKVGDAFEVVRDENGKAMKKAKIAKLRPAKRVRRNRNEARTPVAPAVPDDDDDIDLDEEE